jgi:hypothetical protein
MRPLIAKFKPANGFSRFVYIVLNVLLPLGVFVLVRMQFVQLALVIILLSKWRMFAVRPRFWITHIRANAVDMIVGISLLVLMVSAPSQSLQFACMLAYIGWLIFLKPGSSIMTVSLQALFGLFCGLFALSVGWANGPLYGLVLLSGLICYLAARHFFDSFDEPYAKLLAYIWGYFAAGLAWTLGHWLIFFPDPKSGPISQPAVLLVVLGYGLAAIYYLDHRAKLSRLMRLEFIFITVAIVLFQIGFLVKDIVQVISNR